MEVLTKSLKTLVRLTLVLLIFLSGWAGNYFGSQIWHASQAVCYVDGAVVVACKRDEDENNYVWNIVAIKDEGYVSQEIIFIRHIVPKNKFGYFYAF